MLYNLNCTIIYDVLSHFPYLNFNLKSLIRKNKFEFLIKKANLNFFLFCQFSTKLGWIIQIRDVLNGPIELDTILIRFFSCYSSKSCSTYDIWRNQFASSMILFVLLILLLLLYYAVEFILNYIVKIVVVNLCCCWSRLWFNCKFFWVFFV